MHSFIPSLLLAALASTASGLPSFHGPVNMKRESQNSIPFPTGTEIPAFGENDFAASKTGHVGAFGTGSAHGTDLYSGRHHHHHTGTGTGTGDHHSASATLAARQLSESGISVTGSFPMPTGTGGGFPSGTGFGGGQPSGGFGTGFGGGSPTGFSGRPSGSQSGGFVSPTGGVENFKQNFQSGSAGASGEFPSMSFASGSGFGGGAPTGGFGGSAPSGGFGGGSASPTGGFGQGRQGGGQTSGSVTGGVHNSKRQAPSGSAEPSGSFPSMSIPTGTGFGGDMPTGGFGGSSPSRGFGGSAPAGFASPTSGFGGQHAQQHAQGAGSGGFEGGFPSGTGFPSGGFPSGSGGFSMPTGSGTGVPFPFPTTFQTSVVAPSSAA